MTEGGIQTIPVRVPRAGHTRFAPNVASAGDGVTGGGR